jgi:hypothetical protein
MHWSKETETLRLQVEMKEAPMQFPDCLRPEVMQDYELNNGQLLWTDWVPSQHQYNLR